jgi:hypothetical protein
MQLVKVVGSVRGLLAKDSEESEVLNDGLFELGLQGMSEEGGRRENSGRTFSLEGLVSSNRIKNRPLYDLAKYWFKIAA